MARTRQTFIELNLRLTPEAAAGLKRYCEKVDHAMADTVLYPHKPPKLRLQQSADIIEAFNELDRALLEKHVVSFPWIDTAHVTDQGLSEWQTTKHN